MKWKLPLGMVVVLALGAGGYYVYQNQQPKDVTMVVHPSEFIQQVSISGKVIPTEQLDLSFEQSGRIKNVSAKLSDVVSANQLLASQDTSQLDAQLQGIQANIDLQKAKLNQFLSGVSSEDLALAQTSVTNAETAVSNANDSLQNAEQGLVDVIQSAYTKSDDAVSNKADQFFSNPRSANPSVNLSNIGSIAADLNTERLSIGTLLHAWNSSVSDLTVDGDLFARTAEAKRNLNQMQGFFENLSTAVNNPNVCLVTTSSSCVTVSASAKSDVSTARTTLSSAMSAVTAAEGVLNTAKSSLKTAQGNLKIAKDQLTIKQAPPRTSDISVYQAQVKQAEVSKADLIAQLNKKQIHAPIPGVITNMEAKVGKIAGANQPVISMISSDALEIESYVPEKNLPFVKIGDVANVTLDAYGEDVVFVTKVLSIDPAETVKDGVTTYRIVLQFVTQDSRVKPGMTANVIVNTEKKSNVISVPQGIIQYDKGNKVVQVKEGNSIHYRTVQTGSISTVGSIEITSGLNDGDVVVLKQAGK
ncbi:MAG: efflux RND transporter periplasmic adaptor subunit [Candidatus Uhrbacteria bacterium]|nr:efflux RND transporter periplasmic adaptor subunit [Candidatus Uhrbacteria bacterium]